jgi:hypothetical protein
MGTRRSRRFDTQHLKPGHHVVSSDKWEIMVPPLGLYVNKTVYQDDKLKDNYGCTLVYWGASPQPEAWNPYYTWYVDNACRKCDGIAENNDEWCAACHPLVPKENTDGKGKAAEEG